MRFITLTMMAVVALTGCASTGAVGQEPKDASSAWAPVAEPAPESWRAYIAALDDIDPDIVHGKEEKAVDRGRDQCTSVKESPTEQDKLIRLTRLRFTAPEHPDGFGTAKAKLILKAVRKHICPQY